VAGVTRRLHAAEFARAPHGDYQLTAYAIVAKAHGKCAANVVPYAQETLLTASGPIQQ
jgi:hypothetical protein